MISENEIKDLPIDDKIRYYRLEAEIHYTKALGILLQQESKGVK